MWLPTSVCVHYQWMPKMSFQMYEFELNTEVLFTNKDGRRSYVLLDI